MGRPRTAATGPMPAGSVGKFASGALLATASIIFLFLAHVELSGIHLAERDALRALMPASSGTGHFVGSGLDSSPRGCVNALLNWRLSNLLTHEHGTPSMCCFHF